MSLTAAGAVGLAFALDRAFAEPPRGAHPVAWFGRLVAPFDRTWTHPRLVGCVAALVLPLLAAVVVASVVTLASLAGPIAGSAAAGLALFSCTSLRMLLAVAKEVVAASAADLGSARRSLRALAGRDAVELSAGEVRSAAVESAAENLADGLLAPLVAFAVCAPLSLSLAAGAAVWVKAVNTMDSMLGYRSKPVGWASARLDDLLMWTPARLSALLIALAAADPDALLAGRRWARAPPSPNSGWPMATLAGVLHVRLEKPGVYTLNSIGTLPTPQEARRGVRVVGRAGLLAYCGVGLGLVLGALPGVLGWS